MLSVFFFLEDFADEEQEEMRSQTTVQSGAQQGTNLRKSPILWTSETESGCENMDMTYTFWLTLFFELTFWANVVVTVFFFFFFFWVQDFSKM
jgi:hypothetical protein